MTKEKMQECQNKNSFLPKLGLDRTERVVYDTPR